MARLAPAVLLLAVAAPARADDVDAATTLTAVQLTNEAGDMFRAGNFAGAFDRYGRAFELIHRQTIGVRMARCLVKLGRLNEAEERYLAVIRMPLPAELDPDKLAKQKEAVAQAESEHDALLPRIPAVIVHVTGSSSAAVTIDGRTLPAALLGVRRAADPGPHHIEARTRTDAAVRDVTLAEGQVADVSLEVHGEGAPSTAPSPSTGEAPTPAQPGPGSTSSPLRTAGFVGVGVGAAGVVVGIVSGLLATAKKGDLSGTCGTNLVCSPEHAGDVSTYNTERDVSSIGFIAGGILAAAGITTLLLTSGHGGGSVAASIGPGSVAVGGVF